MPDTQLPDYDQISPRQMGPVPDAVQMPGDQANADINTIIQNRWPDAVAQVAKDKPKQQPTMQKQGAAPPAQQPNPLPAPPQLQNIPQRPDTQPLNVFKEAQPALIFSTVMGSMMMRKHGMGAMAAATGFLQGWETGDKERMDRERQKWNDSVDAAIQQNNVETTKYKYALEDTDMRNKQAAMATLAASFNDPTMRAAVTAGDWNMVSSLVENREKAADNWALAQFKYGTGAGGRGFMGAPVEYKGITVPQNAIQVAHAIESGKQPPTLTGMYGLQGPVRSVMAADGFDHAQVVEEWNVAQKQIASLNGPQMTRFVGLAKSVQNTIGEVETLSQQMRMGGVPAFNHLELLKYIQTEGNSPKGQLAAKYVSAVTTLKEEFASLARGGYAPMGYAWDLANKQINENYGVDELGASLNEINRLIGYRLQGIPNIGTLGPGSQNRYTGMQPQQPAPSGQGGGGAPFTPPSDWQFSPSRQQYRDPEGTIYDMQGNPVQ